MTLHEVAPAKINLALHVTGQRDDGYHLIDSVVVFAEFGDVVTLDGATGLRLTGPEAGALDPADDNLVLRAARTMGAGAQGIILDKRLPVSSGIGGGSSDAAATLRLIARALGRPLPTAAQQLALGADVPVCVAARPARMQGVGEVLSPLPALPVVWLVLVNPRVAVSTPAVFRMLSRRDNPPLPAPRWADFDSLVAWLVAQRNDLQDPATSLVPQIATVLGALSAQAGCAVARMSGSGATCFGMFAEQAPAQAAAAAIAARHPGWWVQATALRG